MKRAVRLVCIGVCLSLSSACLPEPAPPCTTSQSTDGEVTLQCGDDDPVTLVSAEGARGEPGLDAAVRTDPASSEQCPLGGQVISVGLDEDRSGELDEGEATQTFIICQQGGEQSPPVLVSESEAGVASCPVGGRQIEIGSDADMSGTLDPSEVSQTFSLCDGEDGKDGSDGDDGRDGRDGLTGLSQVTVDGAKTCRTGGNLVEIGVDVNANGKLEPDEIKHSFDVCHGKTGAAGEDGTSSLIDVTAEPAGVNCLSGGQKIEVGLDTDRDGVLDPSEVDATQTTYLCRPEPVRFTQIEAGDSHTCALTTAGGVKCWGSGLSGKLGHGSTSDSSAPVDVVGLESGVVSVGVGASHTCALTTAGGVKCWGRGHSGRLGHGSASDSSTPVDVSGLGSGVAALSVGLEHACVVMTGGGAKCWGAGNFGQLGRANTISADVPVDVTFSGASFASISAGGYHTCAVTTNGSAMCWGRGSRGQLGRVVPADTSSPNVVYGLGFGAVASISAGREHTCAVTTSGGAKCWGNGFAGSLGNGDARDENTPVDVTGMASDVASISAGESYTCAVTTDGEAKCWGFDRNGQLGDGFSLGTNSSRVPVDVVGLGRGVAYISAGNDHACAVMEYGVAKCWGRADKYQLGDRISDDSDVPVDVRVD